MSETAQKKKSISKSTRAGLTLPVGRLNTSLKLKSNSKRVGGSAPVYLAACVEYVLAEILQAAGNTAKDRSRKIISPDDVISALRRDEDLSKLYRGSTIYLGGKPKNATAAIAYKEKPKEEKEK